MCTHCYAHSLNFAVGNVIKKSKVCSDALDVAFETTKLVKFSPKRNAAFDWIKAEVFEEDGFALGITILCPKMSNGICQLFHLLSWHGYNWPWANDAAMVGC